MRITEEIEEIILKYESIIERWRSTHSLALNPNQCRELEAVHIALGYGYVDCACGICKGNMMNKMIIALDKLRQNDK